ncbi:PucR family transcriptional regulator [Cohnella suwonensis]|uniref:PucR family transcriptional regulator n=1 Tax=Cohnella suwonensis TaxID=696072 RepID=A0ABW0M1C2_9BACL
MFLTVEQALSVYPLSEGKLIAGRSGSHRVVKSVNVMDAPDITDWIKEGEMLLTTAYLLKDDPEDAMKLLRKLNERGCAGLGIKLGRFWKTIPDNLAEQADALGFPLIELPYQFTFSDQMNGLFQAEMKRNTGILQEVLAKQVRLMRFALQAEPIHRLFEAIADVIGEPFAVIGSRGQLVYASSGVPEGDLADEKQYSPRAKWIKMNDWQAYRVPLMKQDQCTGYALFFNTRMLLSSVEEGLYLQTGELLSYHLNFNYEDYFEHSAQKDFGLLIKRHLKHGLPIETVAEYEHRWEIDLFSPSYRCALTDFPSSSQPDVRTEKLEVLKREYLSHARLQELKGVHVIVEEGVLSVFPDRADDGGESVLSALHSCFSGKSDRADVPTAALSSGKKKPDQLFEAFDECRQTLRLAKDWRMNDRLLKFETLDMAFIFESVPKEKMKAFCDRWLGGLIGRDPEYVQEMMRTLETYLDNDGQLNETAKRLFIHRNTATYRIEKLGELLEVDFKRIDDVLRLKLAFLFKRLLGREPATAERAR